MRNGRNSEFDVYHHARHLSHDFALLADQEQRLNDAGYGIGHGNTTGGRTLKPFTFGSVNQQQVNRSKQRH